MSMDLETPSRENVEYILQAMTKQMSIANTGLLKPDSYDLEKYEDLLDIYHMLMKKRKLTMSEMDAVLSELGRLRKK